jgi:hypothetical protein
MHAGEEVAAAASSVVLSAVAEALAVVAALGDEISRRRPGAANAPKPDSSFSSTSGFDASLSLWSWRWSSARIASILASIASIFFRGF